MPAGPVGRGSWRQTRLLSLSRRLGPDRGTTNGFERCLLVLFGMTDKSAAGLE
jgi:hypothetical protein